MGLYDMTDGTMRPVDKTTFEAEKVLERTHLQAAVRQNIGLLGQDLLVVAEEFGVFAQANRRIDLLCVDRQARLVVVELKRTEDGGHMELQALRYAAMVSAMTFDDLVGIFGRHLAGSVDGDDDDARVQLLAHFDELETDEPVIGREVRIILVASGFDRQITTTALWLNDVFGLDIRCVKWTPYVVGGRLLLDVQSVIPLPEAEEFVVQLRRRETVARAAKTTNRDWTQYVIHTGTGSTPPLRKRRAVMEMVLAVVAAGVEPAALIDVLGRSRWLSVDGVLDDAEMLDAFAAKFPKGDVDRYFTESPVHDGDRTWLLTKMWGPATEPALKALAALVPGSAIRYSAV